MDKTYTMKSGITITTESKVSHTKHTSLFLRTRKKACKDMDLAVGREKTRLKNPSNFNPCPLTSCYSGDTTYTPSIVKCLLWTLQMLRSCIKHSRWHQCWKAEMSWQYGEEELYLLYGGKGIHSWTHSSCAQLDCSITFFCFFTCLCVLYKGLVQQFNLNKALPYDSMKF